MFTLRSQSKNQFFQSNGLTRFMLQRLPSQPLPFQPKRAHGAST